MNVVELEVLGTPAPKGSSRAFMTRGPNPRAVLAPSGSKQNREALRSWDQSVRMAAAEAVGHRSSPVFVETPLIVKIVFRLARPSGHWGKRGLKPSAPGLPITKPDSDKLTRATLDSMKGTVYDDDARVVLKLVGKVYAEPGNEGASIRIEACSPFAQNIVLSWNMNIAG